VNLESWIAQRWLDPVQDATDLRKQVRRGKVLARKGKVKNLTVRPGLVTAEVQNDTGGVLAVKIRQPVLHEASWDEMVEVLADNPGFSALLLDGRISEDMVEAFDLLGIDLFPFDLLDLTHFCSCHEDTARGCTHAVATHFALASALGADPFLLFEFRGRPGSWLIEQLRARRDEAKGGVASDDEDGAGAAGAEEDADERGALEPAEAVLDGFWERGVLPHIGFRARKEDLDASESLPVIRALGPGPGEIPPDRVADVLAPIVRQARRRAEDIIEEAAEATSIPTMEEVDMDSLDDILVAAAHQHGVLTSSFVAKALGIGQREARRYLLWLVEEGRLEKVGRARGTKYVIPGTRPPGTPPASEEEVGASAPPPAAEAAAG